MDALLQKLFDAILDSGQGGLMLLAVVFVGYYFHKQNSNDRNRHIEQIGAINSKHDSQISEITKQSNEHHTAMANRLVDLVEKNTEALTRAANTTENCGTAIAEIGRTLNSCMNLITELSVMFRGHKQ